MFWATTEPLIWPQSYTRLYNNFWKEKKPDKMEINRKWDKRQPVYHKYIVSFSPTVWADPLYSVLTQKPGIGSFSSVRIVLFIGHSPKIKKNPISIALGNGCSATFTVAHWVSKVLTSSGYNKVIYLGGTVELMGAVSTLCSCRAKIPSYHCSGFQNILQNRAEPSKQHL